MMLPEKAILWFIGTMIVIVLVWFGIMNYLIVVARIECMEVNKDRSAADVIFICRDVK